MGRRAGSGRGPTRAGTTSAQADTPRPPSPGAPAAAAAVTRTRATLLAGLVKGRYSMFVYGP